MHDYDETSTLCGLATEFANVARLYHKAAEANQGAAAEGLSRSGDLRQAIADRIVATFAPEALPAGGSWLPSAEEVEFRLKAIVDRGWAGGALTAADQQLFTEMRGLLLYAKPSGRVERAVRDARAALSADADMPRAARPSTEQPG